MSETRTDYNPIPDIPEQLTLSLDSSADNQARQERRDSQLPYQRPRQEFEDTVAQIVSATGVAPHLVDQIVEMAMTALHKHALTNKQGIYGLLHNCYWAFGLETTYHLGGIVEEVHRTEPNEGWSETLALLRPREEWEPIQEIVGQWYAQRSDKRKATDETHRQYREELFNTEAEASRQRRNDSNEH